MPEAFQRAAVVERRDTTGMRSQRTAQVDNNAPSACRQAVPAPRSRKAGNPTTAPSPRNGDAAEPASKRRSMFWFRERT